MRPAVVVTKRYAGMGIVRGLGIQRVPVIVAAYDSVQVDASKYVQRTVRVPDPQTDEEACIDALVALADEYGGSFLTPATDEALAAISRHKSCLADHYLVACTDWDVTQLYLDKSYTYALAAEVGIPAPSTLTPSCVDEVEAYGKTVDYPVLIKPRQSHLFEPRFRAKMFSVNSFDQLMSKYREAAAAEQKVMIQEFITGPDSAGVNYNAYVYTGYEPVEFTARKVRNTPPQYGSPRVVVAEDVPEIIEPGRKILEAMHYQGFACVEFKRDDRDGVYKLMEVNGRHNRSAMLAVRCGLNFPWVEYAHLVLGHAPQPTEYQRGVYWSDLLSDIKSSIKYRSVEQYSLREYLKPYINPTAFAVLDRRDIKPFVKRLFAGFGFSS